mmetsp:Transcript_105733/g.281647  ORF Transcript_105733/g.281647 Transcript_105733/m.281647 type:complete len:419 (-) Transcript_105733:166-1422(-)
MVSSVSSIFLLQSWNFALSSLCCFSSSVSMLSMASFTLVKESKRMRTAKVANAQLPWRHATSAMRFLELSTAWSWAAVRPDVTTWMKLIVLPYKSRASSVLRMASASPRARTSSVLTAERSWYSLSSALHVSRMLPTKPRSAARASSVDSPSLLALAAASRLSASRACFASFCLFAILISVSFAARNFWKVTSASKSCFCALDKSLDISSFISLSMPRIPPLRELYDFAPAACPCSPLGWPASNAPCASADALDLARTALLPVMSTARSWKEPSTSNRSCCITPRKPPERFPARASRTWSSVAAASLASLALPPCFCNSCTLARTSMAWPRRDTVSFTSASSARNWDFSFSRTEAAFATASLSASMSSLRPAISVFSTPASAVDFSMVLPSSSILCSAVLMAAVFSLSFVSHQHMYFS